MSCARVTVELFGSARSACGVRLVNLDLPSETRVSDLARALASALPALVGVAIDERMDALTVSYTANLNGLDFLGDTARKVADGDRVLVFSSQAGG